MTCNLHERWKEMDRAFNKFHAFRSCVRAVSEVLGETCISADDNGMEVGKSALYEV